MSLDRARRRPHQDVWCGRCGRASRFGQWVPGDDACPYCEAPGALRRPWTLLRLHCPDLPLRPQPGHPYPCGPSVKVALRLPRGGELVAGEQKNGDGEGEDQTPGVAAAVRRDGASPMGDGQANAG